MPDPDPVVGYEQYPEDAGRLPLSTWLNLVIIVSGMPVDLA